MRNEYARAGVVHRCRIEQGLRRSSLSSQSRRCGVSSSSFDLHRRYMPASALSLTRNPAHPWFLWVLLAWGIALAVHDLVLLVKTRPKKGDTSGFGADLSSTSETPPNQQVTSIQAACSKQPKGDFNALINAGYCQQSPQRKLSVENLMDWNRVQGRWKQRTAERQNLILAGTRNI
jgi:hypothetical protein